jgi:hypothetical protein
MCLFFSFFYFVFTREGRPHTGIIPAAPQETLGEAGIEHGTAALQYGSPSRLSQLS